MLVKTGNADLKFRVQGKLANYTEPISVTLDHNVQCKLDDGTLVSVKRSKTPAKEKEKKDK